jgi:hypothetical protein
MNKERDDDIAVDAIRDYLKLNGYKNALDCLDKEVKLVEANEKNNKNKEMEEKNTKLLKLVQGDKEKNKVSGKLNENYKLLEKKHKSILQCARQIFSIVINCLQQLHNIKDGNNANENLGETIENYRSQIQRYHKIITTDEWDEKSDLMNQAVMIEHKKKFFKAKEDKNNEGIIEVLLSLRVNALQISPELRKNLVYELIRNDTLNIEETKENNFVIDLLNIPAYSLRHAILSLISIIAATYKGVEYLTSNGCSIVEKIIEIMKSQNDNGSVIQRFCIAILQKMSVKEDIIPIYMKNNLIDWIIKLLGRSRYDEIHIFCLDFASALLANILHSNSTLDYLENNLNICKGVRIFLFSSQTHS